MMADDDVDDVDDVDDRCRLDNFIINKLEAECGTKLQHANFKRLTLNTETFGSCKTPGCQGAFFTRLAVLHTIKKDGENKIVLLCDSCNYGVGPCISN